MTYSQDGTINYLTLPAVVYGLRFLTAYLPFLPLRLSCLIHFMTRTLLQLRHDTTNTPIVQILSRLPGRRLKSIGEQSDTGSTVSMLFYGVSFLIVWSSSGPLRLVFLAPISRTGICCPIRSSNMLLQGTRYRSGQAVFAILAVLLRYLESKKTCNVCILGWTLKDFEHHMGRELGVVRISLGLASNFQDVWRVLEFVSLIGKEAVRQAMWHQWVESKSTAIAL